jgi:hypothetical protein
MSTGQHTREGEEMAALDVYVPLVHTEADGLAQFLATLSADDWQRPSSLCDRGDITV